MEQNREVLGWAVVGAVATSLGLSAVAIALIFPTVTTALLGRSIHLTIPQALGVALIFGIPLGVSQLNDKKEAGFWKGVATDIVSQLLVALWLWMTYNTVGRWLGVSQALGWSDQLTILGAGAVSIFFWAL